ncbi:MAG: ferredoxin III, nif-specific, partial [Pseudomonas sp.]|nr:ferredoxin III, nif-specific [Pseudomonas sp.]
VTALDAQKCIGCGRCYKVCPRDVFTLVERSEMVEDADDFDDDDEMMVMTVQDGLDCIGCKACAAVCPKQCHTHEAAAA